MLGNLAIDIGSHETKVLGLSQKGGLYAVKYFREEPAGEDSKSISEKVDSLTGLAKETRLKNPTIVMAESVSEVVMREITLQNIPSSDNALEGEISSALASVLPFSLEQVYFDYVKKVGDTFLVAACRKELSDYKTQILAKLWGNGKYKSVIDIDAYAYGRLLTSVYQSELQENNAVLLVDIGFKNSRFYVFSQEGLLFNRIQQIGGEQVSYAIVDVMNTDKQHAEKIKLEGRFTDEITEKVVLPYAQQLNEQISLVKDFYEASRRTEHSISRVVLCGGGACLDGLLKQLKKSSVLSTELIDLSSIVRVESIPSADVNTFLSKYALAFSLLVEGV